MRQGSELPRSIGGILVPDDAVSRATWAWAQRRLPRYLLAHSARSYCWGVTLATNEGLAFDAAILWTAALIHDVGLTQIPRNEACFEFQGGRIARRLLVGEGMTPGDADRAARAIELHMAPSRHPRRRCRIRPPRPRDRHRRARHASSARSTAFGMRWWGSCPGATSIVASWPRSAARSPSAPAARASACSRGSRSTGGSRRHRGTEAIDRELGGEDHGAVLQIARTASRSRRDHECGYRRQSAVPEVFHPQDPRESS